MIGQLLQMFLGANGIVLAVTIARQFERKWPIQPDLSHAEIAADWKATGANLGLGWIIGPITGASGAAIVNALGGGFISLRTDGWWYIVSLIGLVIASDLYRYGSHRLQHAVPFLWAMHSFHHSAEAVTFVTGARHYWLERVIFGAFLPVLPILFTIPTSMNAIVGLIFFLPDSCAHLNVRFSMGRAITWINSPQWHRIHHSNRPEHRDKNFASLLPCWDILFGTAWIPRPGEYPATGIIPSEKVTIVDSIVWPFRHVFRRVQPVRG